MGTAYSLHETTLEAGVELRFEYVRHRETVYCLEGEGSVEDVASGRRTPLRPGSLYSAGIGEPHVVRTETHVKVLCVFTPALIGSEEADSPLGARHVGNHPCGRSRASEQRRRVAIAVSVGSCRETVPALASRRASRRDPGLQVSTSASSSVEFTWRRCVARPHHRRPWERGPATMPT
jgi:hypothetical protein